MVIKTLLTVGTALWLSSFADGATLSIATATDWGGTVSGFSPLGAIDGATTWGTRWVASTTLYPTGVNLVLDLGSNQDVTDVGIAWGKGDDYTHSFEIRSLVDGGSGADWVKVLDKQDSTGTTEGYDVYDITDVSARYIRIKVFSNSIGDDEQMIKEVQLYDNGSSPVTSPTASPVGSGYGLDSTVAPSENFDLLGWYVGVPVPDDDGFASEISETDLDDEYESEYFYTGTDGAMVFWTDGNGVTTSLNTMFIRSELREMIRRGNTSIKTKSKENNWAFSTISSSDYDLFGGIDGELTATLAVDHVMVTGTDLNWEGRIIIGQIHAENNEPCRLYYQKLSNNTKGGVYFGHELSVSEGGADIYYNLLGDMAEENPVDFLGEVKDASDPIDGIALGEIFSYSILVDGNDLTVTITQNGVQLAQTTVDMVNSGYDVTDNYQYFKAGLYLQDNTFDSSDYAEVSFYELSYTHDYSYVA